MHTKSNLNATKKNEDEVFGDLNQLTKSLHELDDRGLVLSISAFAEDTLGSLLKAFMFPCSATTQLLDGFNAPFGTFSARIKGAYSLGLITEVQFNDLELLRKIRNKFAHTWLPIDIAQVSISSLIKEMSYSRLDKEFPDTSSKKIRSSMSCLLVELRSATHQISRLGTEAKLSGRHLMAGFSGTPNEQLDAARNELNEILQNIKKSKGDERKFYRERLNTFLSRLTVLEFPKTLDKIKEFQSMIKEVKDLLLLYPT